MVQSRDLALDDDKGEIVTEQSLDLRVELTNGQHTFI